jgi:hypothetical protein
MRHSFYRKCRSGFRNLPSLYPRDGYADDTRMVEVVRIHDCSLRPIHHDSRLDALVPNPEDPRESPQCLELSTSFDTEFDSTGAQLLRILEQHFSSICT